MVSPQQGCSVQCWLKLFIFMSPAVRHSSSRSLLALWWGIPSRVLFEPYRGASPARLLFKYFCGGSSPSRVFTEDFSFRLSSRAVFSSPRHRCFCVKIQYLEDWHLSTPSFSRINPQQSCWHDELYQCLSILTRDKVDSWSPFSSMSEKSVLSPQSFLQTVSPHRVGVSDLWAPQRSFHVAFGI